MSFNIVWALACTLSAVSALTPAQWRSQSIYQVLTDRFARTDGSTTASCNTADQVYCGGTWEGIINHLDYIQGMGFTAVRLAYSAEVDLYLQLPTDMDLSNSREPGRRHDRR